MLLYAYRDINENDGAYRSTRHFQRSNLTFCAFVNHKIQWDSHLWKIIDDLFAPENQRVTDPVRLTCHHAKYAEK